MPLARTMKFTLRVIFLATFTTLSDATSSAPPTDQFFQCDFENGDLCSLEQSTNDDFNWTLHQGGTPTGFTGPTVDHTTGTSVGYYVYTEPPLTGQLGKVAILVSPDLASGNTRCLEFFYHMYGVNVGSLEVLSQNTDDGSANPERLWRQSLNKGDAWQRGLITIPSTSNNFQLMFKATLGDGTQNDIALDDITLSSGLCPYDSVLCDFEDPLLCGYTFDDTADVRFVYGSGSTPSSFTGPSADHTYGNASGHYMLLEASGLREGMTARLVSPMIAGSADGSNCLILWYHMYGLTVGTLAVFSKSRSSTDLGSPLWFASGNKGDRWRAVEMDLTSEEDFQVIIEATGTGDYKNDISFDDAMITGRICPGEYVFKNSSGVTCDFESTDLCYYRQDKTDTADWTWQNGATSDEFTGPDVDHTLDSDLGFYMTILGDQSSSGGEVARLISPKFEPTTASSCLEFWYHMYGDDVESLNVYLVEADYSELPETPSWSQSGDQGNYWHRATFVFPTREEYSRIVFEGRYGIRERDDVAIDDVVLYHSESCPEFSTTPPPPTTPPPMVDDISCDFEVDFCNYTQATDDLFDWSRHRGPTESRGSGPDVDHTLGTALGSYALMDCNNQYLRYDDRARLISPLLQPSRATRCLQFFYYKYSINDRTQDFLNVYIKEWGHRLGFDPDWSVYGVTAEPEWMEGKLELPPSDAPFQVVFEGSYGFYEYYCDIAIDDIMLQQSSCGEDPPGQDRETINCDFEGTDDPFCGFVQGFPQIGFEDRTDWSIGSGSTPTEGIGPENDHTLGNSDGHYMYLEASQPTRPGDNAAVTSPTLKRSLDHMCLQFFYHMNGKDTGWLRVLLTVDNEETKEVARISGQQEYGWRPMLVDIPSLRGKLRITFEGKVGGSFESDIAIDDIMTVREPCGGFPDSISCDFELGFDSCKYDSLDTGPYNRWSWYDKYIGDSAVEGGSGSYMFSSSTGTHVASIKSNGFQMTSSSSCLMFDYAIKGTSSSLQIKSVSSSDAGDLDTLRAETEWTSYQITLIPSTGVMRIQFIATTTDSTVAVDNVIVLSGSCNNDRTTAEPVSGKSGTSPGIIVVVVLIALAVLVMAVVLALVIRTRKGSFGPAFSYKNQSDEAQLTSSTTISEDPGIANPNYEPQKLTNSA